MYARLFLFSFWLFLMLGCCVGSSDVNPTTLTLGKLDTIGMVVVAMCHDGIDCTKFDSIDDFVKEADKAQMIIKEEVVVHRYENDAWGNRFHWKLRSSADANIIIIISNGSNGVYQAGDGDDLSLIVTIPHHGQPTTEIRVGRATASSSDVGFSSKVMIARCFS